MPLIVDCYNVLYTTMPPSLAGLDERRLCELLSRGAWHGPTMVVCDGRIKPDGLSRSPVDGVELIYSGPKRCADSVIIEIIQDSSAPGRLLVVSSDRQIQKAARRRHAQFWTSERLITVLAQLSATGRPAAKSHTTQHDSPTDHEVAYWLEQFGYAPDAKIDPEETWPEMGTEID